MSQAVTQSDSDVVRSHVREVYLKPAIQRGERVFVVNAGAVHKALALNNRVPLVCAALKSRKFLDDNKLRLVAQSGPPSGQSTTVTFTYEILAPGARAASPNPLIGLRGVAKDLFRELGGGESFIRGERSNFDRQREK